MEKRKPWEGRFTGETSDILETFSASVDYDQRLAEEDIDGSIAYAYALQKAKILTLRERREVVAALGTIREEVRSGKFYWDKKLEDVHMNIEARLIKLTGVLGEKIHTGRSRNDQVATDIRLYLRRRIDDILTALVQLATQIVRIAKNNISAIIPMYTHLQPAQPMLFSHHMMAWYEMIKRDCKRFMYIRTSVNVLPLGSGAGVGSNYPLDRNGLANLLHFDQVSENSLDAVADRDFAIEFCSGCSIAMMHLSRFGEEIILWMSAPFSFINLPDELCTGSSIMPQKKNPDAAELIRGKSARVFGHVMAILSLMKGQPLGYNRDNQEDKELLFDCYDTLQASLKMMTAIVGAIIVKKENMEKAAEAGFLAATDAADYLVQYAVPFRKAHRIVGMLIQKAETEKRSLRSFTSSELEKFHPSMGKTEFGECLSLRTSIKSKKTFGGTALAQVEERIQNATFYLGVVGKKVENLIDKDRPIVL